MAQSKTPVFAREATGLVRSIDWKQAFSFNLMNIGLGFCTIYMVFAAVLYPGVNLAEGVLITVGFSLFMATTFYLLSTAMPRTGGDYVYVTRIVHPSVGLVSSWIAFLLPIPYVGILPTWVMIYGVSPMLWTLGKVMGNSSLIAISQVLSGLNLTFAISLVLIAMIILIVFIGTKFTMRFVQLCFALAFLGLIVIMSTVLAAGHSTFVARLAEVGGMNASSIISKAQGLGYVAGFTLGGTFLGFVYNIFNFNGYYYTIYYAGEIKQARKTQLYSIYGALLFAGLVVGLFYYVWDYIIGAPLLHSLDYLYTVGNPAYTIPLAPYAHNLMLFLTANPILLVLGYFAIIFSALGSAVTTLFTPIRILFAWSFDRLIPAKFSELDRRFGQPWRLAAVCSAAGVIFAVLNVYSTYLNFLAFNLPLFPIYFGLVAIAALLFPFRRKGLFSNSPPEVQRRIGGFPVISLVALVSLIASAFILYATMTPAYNGGPVSSQYLYVTLTIIVVGIVLFAISWLYNKARGINLTETYREIPPE